MHGCNKTEGIVLIFEARLRKGAKLQATGNRTLEKPREDTA